MNRTKTRISKVGTVVVPVSDQDRATTGLSDLLIATPSGHVPLRMLAEVEETDGPNQIQRENGRRRIAVYGNGDGRRRDCRKRCRSASRTGRRQRFERWAWNTDRCTPNFG